MGMVDARDGVADFRDLTLKAVQILWVGRQVLFGYLSIGLPKLK